MSKQKENTEKTEQENTEKIVAHDDFSNIEGEEITLVSGAEYWNFENSKIFVGVPTGFKNNEEGELIGINCKSLSGKMEWLVPATHSIIQAMQMEVPGEEGKVILGSGYPVKFEFIEKIQLKNGRDFNKFKITLIKRK